MLIRRDPDRAPQSAARRTAGGAVVLLALGTVLTGCGSSGGVSSVTSAVASAKSEASGAISKGAAALESASAAASSALAQVKNGLDAKGQVKLGAVAAGSDGRKSVDVTVTNTDSGTRDFAVTVDFRDSGGNLLDTSVLTIKGVAAGATGKGTAHSNRTLDGTVTAEVAAALRY